MVVRREHGSTPAQLFRSRGDPIDEARTPLTFRANAAKNKPTCTMAGPLLWSFWIKDDYIWLIFSLLIGLFLTLVHGLKASSNPENLYDIVVCSLITI